MNSRTRPSSTEWEEGKEGKSKALAAAGPLHLAKEHVLPAWMPEAFDAVGGSPDVLATSMRDVVGKAVKASFYDEPIDVTESTNVLARKVSHALVGYFALLSKGYKAEMHGMRDTFSSLQLIVWSLPGTLAQHAEVWLLTGTGHHTAKGSHQRSEAGGVLRAAVEELLRDAGYAYYMGKDAGGHSGALLVVPT